MLGKQKFYFHLLLWINLGSSALLEEMCNLITHGNLLDMRKGIYEL